MNLIIGALLMAPQTRSYALDNAQNDSYWEEAIPQCVLVVYERGWDVGALTNRLLAIGAYSIEGPGYEGSNFLKAWMPDESRETSLSFIEKVLNEPGVICADPDGLAYTSFVPNDTYYNLQWGPPAINAENAWDVWLGSSGKDVGMLDTGVEYTHPDLSAQYTGTKGYDFVDNDSDPAPDVPSAEYHGTHTSGTVAAVINNATGVAGISDGTLYACRVCNESGSCYWSSLINAVNWCDANGVELINMSLGGSSGSSGLQNALDNFYANGGLSFASSGNSGGGSISYPARYSSVIAVGSVGQSLNRSSFSQYGPELELMGPGENILSTVTSYYNPPYAYLNGTSMSCPHATGVGLWYWTKQPSWSNTQIRNTLQTTAVDLGSAGWDQFYGYGLVWMETSVGAEEQAEAPRYIVTAQSPSRNGLSFLLPTDVSSTLELYDASGRLVKSLKDARGEVSVPTASGVYIWRAASETGQASGKAVVAN